MKIASAACCGIAHMERQAVCQDVVGGQVWETHGAVVLADGAGSCLHALEGAQTVVDTVLDLLFRRGLTWLREESSRETLGEELIDGCLRALGESAYPVEEQASTLLFCAVDAEGVFLCGHIGDGYAFRAGAEKGELLSDAENGRRSNETVFVTSPGAKNRLRLTCGRLAENESIILCSDGAGTSLYQRQAKVCAPALQRIANWMCVYQGEDVSRILEINLQRSFSENTVDDMSLAVITHQKTDAC